MRHHPGLLITLWTLSEVYEYMAGEGSVGFEYRPVPVTDCPTVAPRPAMRPKAGT